MLVATSPTSLEPNAPEESAPEEDDKKHPVATVEQRLSTCRASPKAAPDVPAATHDCRGEPPGSIGSDLRAAKPPRTDRSSVCSHLDSKQ